jgi:hypothetical protein
VLTAISLGLPVHTKCKWYEWDFIGNGPFVTARFKYRSLGKSSHALFSSDTNFMTTDALRALHVVPPPVLLEERPEEELNVDELQELVKNLKVKNANLNLQSRDID